LWGFSFGKRIIYKPGFGTFVEKNNGLLPVAEELRIFLDECGGDKAYLSRDF